MREFLVLLLFFQFLPLSCSSDETTSGAKESHISFAQHRVKQLIFEEPDGYIDSILFYYEQNKLSAADWKIFSTYPAKTISLYKEIRHRDSNQRITSLKGASIWDISYQYSKGAPEEIITNRDIGWTGTLKYYTTTTFLEYVNDCPTKIKIDSYLANHDLLLVLKYNTKGNIINIKTTDSEDKVRDDIAINYNDDVNPFKKLLETPLIDTYGYHNNEVFYYSSNLPVSITKTRYFEESRYCVKTELSYSYVKDEEKRVITVIVNARITDSQHHEFYNNLAYRMGITYY